MLSDAPTVLPLPANELPDITDAGIGLNLLLVATLTADRERQALMARIADAACAGDWSAAVDLFRRLSAVPGAVSRLGDVARAGIERFDAGLGDPADGPAGHARTRRSLVRSANWLETRFWPMYGVVRPVPPPAAAPPRPKACRKAVRNRLYLLDDELVRLSADARSAAATARVIILSDRNGQAARCRACGACRLATTPLTRDIPLP